MNLSAQEAFRILEWQRVYNNELGTSDEDKDIIMSLIECLKDCNIPFGDNDYTYHHMYEHLKNHTFPEYYQSL